MILITPIAANINALQSRNKYERDTYDPIGLGHKHYAHLKYTLLNYFFKGCSDLFRDYGSWSDIVLKIQVNFQSTIFRSFCSSDLAS